MSINIFGISARCLPFHPSKLSICTILLFLCPSFSFYLSPLPCIIEHFNWWWRPVPSNHWRTVWILNFCAQSFRSFQLFLFSKQHARDALLSSFVREVVKLGFWHVACNKIVSFLFVLAHKSRNKKESPRSSNANFKFDYSFVILLNSKQLSISTSVFFLLMRMSSMKICKSLRFALNQRFQLTASMWIDCPFIYFLHAHS